MKLLKRDAAIFAQEVNIEKFVGNPANAKKHSSNGHSKELITFYDCVGSGQN